MANSDSKKRRLDRILNTNENDNSMEKPAIKRRRSKHKTKSPLTATVNKYFY